MMFIEIRILNKKKITAFPEKMDPDALIIYDGTVNEGIVASETSLSHVYVTLSYKVEQFRGSL